MANYVKGKYNFTLKGVSYKDINGYNYIDNPKSINIGVAGTAQMVRQWMKQKYPQIPSSYYWVRSESYSGGDSIKIYLNNAPKELYEKLDQELNSEFEEGTFNGMDDSYTYTKDAEQSKEGLIINYGTKYLFVRNQPPYDVKVDPVDWNMPTKSQSSKPMLTRSSATKPSYSMGDVIKECAGWIISKKTLPDGRIVYNAKIKPDTPVNKNDWQEIKNEVYTKTGFKWGKFAAFEKWGVIASEAAVVNILCEILDKYYPSQSQPQAPLAQAQAQPQEELLFHVGDKFSSKKELSYFYEIESISGDNVEYSRHNIDDGTTQFFSGTTKYINSQIRNGEWVKYEPQQSTSQPKLNFNVGDVFYSKDYPNSKYYIKSINTFNDEVGFASVRLPDRESIYGTIDEVSRLFESGQWVKEGTFNYAQSTPISKSKEDIQKAINGLKYLADKGNEQAAKAIKGLEYLLNK